MDRRAFLRGGLGVLGSGVLGCAPGPRLDGIAPDALALHREALVLDLHVDTLLWSRLFGYELAKRHHNRLPWRPFGFHMDLPRAREGGLDAAVMGLVINPADVRGELMFPLKFLAWWERGEGVEQTLATLGELEAQAAEHPEELRFVRSGSELAREVAAGRFAALAGLEGCHGLEREPLRFEASDLRRAFEQGLRMVGLVHFQQSAAGAPMTVEAMAAQGAGPAAIPILDECRALGAIVDLAHLNRRGVAELLPQLRDPFVVSHTACAALHDHPRNLDDSQLRAIGDAGGVIGIAAGRSFIGRPGVEGLLDHIEHALRVAGEDAVALGTDFDGFILPVTDFDDVRRYPLVTAGLLQRGHPPDRIAKLLGTNALQVIASVCG